MDVNATPLHLVAGERDWRRVLDAGTSIGLIWDPERRGVVPASETELALRSAGSRFGLETRRGAAADRFGNIWWIGDDEGAAGGGERTALWMQAAARGGAGAQVWSVRDLESDCSRGERLVFAPKQPDPQVAARPAELRGLTVTTASWIVVGTLAPNGLLAFDVHAGGPPTWLSWPDPQFAPVDMAATPDGGFWVLESDGVATTRLHCFDRNLRRLELEPGSEQFIDPSADPFAVTCDPAVSAASESCRRVDGLTLDGSPDTFERPIAIESGPDGSLFVLDAAAGATRLHHVVASEKGSGRGVAISTFPLAGEELRDKAGLSTAHDFVLRLQCNRKADQLEGEMFVATNDKHQVLAYRVVFASTHSGIGLSTHYLPTRGFTGKGLVGGVADVFYDSGDRWLPVAEQPRVRYRRSALAAGDGLVFDGKIRDCVWHRLVFDACIPSGCKLRVRARAANERDELATTPWSDVEPAPVRRPDGSEQPFHQPFDRAESMRDGLGTWESLVQRAIGRFVELRLEFSTDIRSACWVRAMRLYYQRFSYRERYLPAVYGEDRESAVFLDRFLGNFEGVLTALEGRVASSQVLFDSDTAPPDYLDWLAGWLGATLGQDWEEERRRLFLSRAEQLFRWRGTPIGLRALIRLGIDECIDESELFAELDAEQEQPLDVHNARSVRIIEHAMRRGFPGVALGDPTAPGEFGTIPSELAWEPAHGAGPLHARYVAFLQERYGGSDEAALMRLYAAWNRSTAGLFSSGVGSEERADEVRAGFDLIRLPAVEPSQSAQRADWAAFVSGPIGFTYTAVTADHTESWRSFLRSRYARNVDAMNAAHGRAEESAWDKFADVELPDRLPDGGSELLDWIQFVSLSLPIAANAHRFTVLVPAAPGESRAVRLRRLERVEQIVERERPAHTTFDAKLFWDLFQVGSARLGVDTALGEGGRYVAMALDAGYLGETYLGASHPWNAAERTVLGRDALSEN